MENITNSEVLRTLLNALADTINSKTQTSGVKKDIASLIAAVSGIVGDANAVYATINNTQYGTVETEYTRDGSTLTMIRAPYSVGEGVLTIL